MSVPMNQPGSVRRVVAGPVTGPPVTVGPVSGGHYPARVLAFLGITLGALANDLPNILPQLKAIFPAAHWIALLTPISALWLVLQHAVESASTETVNMSIPAVTVPVPGTVIRAAGSVQDAVESDLAKYTASHLTGSDLNG